MTKSTVLLVLWVALTTTTTLVRVVAAADKKDSSGKLPPPFFFQDPTDSLCLAGDEFKRCSIDTLWYVTQSPGAKPDSGEFQIHKYPPDGLADDQDDGQCLTKKSCKDSDIGKKLEVKLTKCSNCGAKGWFILGQNEDGYTIMIDDKKSCLARYPATTEGARDKVFTAPCDSPDTPLTRLTLQFASAADIATMQSPGARLVSAATDGDKKKVQAILKEDGVDINVVDWDGLNALIPAASAGHLDLVKYLVQQGINVNTGDKDGITALMEASIMGHVKIVEYLIDHGADVDQKAETGITALWLAASEGKDDVIALLLKKGADPTITRVDDISALMTAAIGGYTSTTKLLLKQQGVTAMQTDSQGMTPLHSAAEKGDVDLLKALVESVPEADRSAYVNQVSTTQNFTPLLLASAHGNLDALKYLMTVGADVKYMHPDQNVTALMYAAANKHIKVLNYLLELGIFDLNQRHTGGGTALTESASMGAVDSIQILLEAGADPQAMDDDGVNVLMSLSTSCYIDVVAEIWRRFEEKGVAEKELNRMSYSGGTPVMFAAAGGNMTCIQFFVDKGANLNVMSAASPTYLEKIQMALDAGLGPTDENQRHVEGVTPLHVCAQGGNTECVKLMVSKGAKLDVVDELGRTPLTVAIRGNFGETAIALIEAGSDPNTVYKEEDDGVEHNLLFDAIMVENEEFAKVLIEKGADIYYKDSKSVSTLLQASHRGLTDIVEALLKVNTKGLEYVDGPSDEGVTPLLSASNEGHLDVVKLLLKAGANKNRADNDGTTPLMAACSRGHLPIVKALVDAGALLNEQNNDGHTALMFAYNGKNQVETLHDQYKEFYAKQKDGASSMGVNEDETGLVITEALANFTGIVDFLMTSGADSTLKDKEGHVARDFDYQADNPAVFGSSKVSASSTDSAKEEL